MNGKATGSWEGIRWPALPGANRGASHRYLCYNLESAGQVQFLAGLRPVFAKYSIGREERGDAIAEEGGLRSSLCFLLAQAAAAASFTAVAEPELSDAQVLVADLYGTGEQNLLLGKEQGVFILTEDGPRQLIEVFGRASALAVGDVTGTSAMIWPLAQIGAARCTYIQNGPEFGNATAMPSIFGIPSAAWVSMISTATAGAMWSP